MTTISIQSCQKICVCVMLKNSCGKVKNASITWTSSKTNKATVLASTITNNCATVTGISVGSSIITATITVPGLPSIQTNFTINITDCPVVPIVVVPDNIITPVDVITPVDITPFDFVSSDNVVADAISNLQVPTSFSLPIPFPINLPILTHKSYEPHKPHKPHKYHKINLKNNQHSTFEELNKFYSLNKSSIQTLIQNSINQKKDYIQFPPINIVKKNQIFDK